MDNSLIYFTGVDIPFPEFGVSIHQPTIKEISLIGEETFFAGCELLQFSKNNIKTKDSVDLENYSDFDLFLMVLNSKREDGEEFQKKINSVYMVLDLLLPNYEISLIPNGLQFKNDELKKVFFLNNMNFEAFKELIKKILYLDTILGSDNNYNPKGKMAEDIANKLKKRQEKLKKQREAEGKNDSILFKYVSNLSVGAGIDINSIFNYSLSQLFTSYTKFISKESFDYSMKARMAGADIESPPDWKD